MATDPAALLDAEFGSFPGLIAAWGAHRGEAVALDDGTTTLSWRKRLTGSSGWQRGCRQTGWSAGKPWRSWAPPR